jgi:hypothetical protein
MFGSLIGFFLALIPEGSLENSREVSESSSVTPGIHGQRIAPRPGGLDVRLSNCAEWHVQTVRKPNEGEFK